MRILFMLLAVLATAVLPAAAATQQASGSVPKTATSAKPAVAPVNLNTATQAQLETLPGVGPKAAQRVLDYRKQNGNFKKIEDLMNVKGFGEKTFLKLKPMLLVSDKSSGPGSSL